MNEFRVVVRAVMGLVGLLVVRSAAELRDTFSGADDLLGASLQVAVDLGDRGREPVWSDRKTGSGALCVKGGW
ncbi:MAG: hypothetical protein WA731_21275 [Pseudonocardiaceae bacterium]